MARRGGAVSASLPADSGSLTAVEDCFAVVAARSDEVLRGSAVVWRGCEVVPARWIAVSRRSGQVLRRSGVVLQRSGVVLRRSGEVLRRWLVVLQRGKRFCTGERSLRVGTSLRAEMSLWTSSDFGAFWRRSASGIGVPGQNRGWMFALNHSSRSQVVLAGENAPKRSRAAAS